MNSGVFKYAAMEGWPRLPAGVALKDVSSVAVDSHDRVYLFARAETPVLVFAPDGSYLFGWGQGVCVRPHGISIGPDDAVWLADDGDHTVRKFTPDGRLLLTLGTSGQPSDTGAEGKNPLTVKRAAGPFHYPTHLAVAPSGELYVSDGYGNARVHRFTANGRLIQSWGEPGTGPGQFCLPHSILVGPDSRVFVADRENSRVQVFSPDGAWLAEWTDLSRPTDLFLDRQGRLFISELGHKDQYVPGTWVGRSDLAWSRVSLWDLDGHKLGEFGGPQSSGPASLYAAHGISGDSHGCLYVSEVSWSAAKGNPPDGVHGVQKFVPA